MSYSLHQELVATIISYQEELLSNGGHNTVVDYHYNINDMGTQFTRIAEGKYITDAYGSALTFTGTEDSGIFHCTNIHNDLKGYVDSNGNLNRLYLHEGIRDIIRERLDEVKCDSWHKLFKEAVQEIQLELIEDGE